MAKEILATNIDGFLIKHAAFIEPHVAWFDRAIKLTRDTSLEGWKHKKDYFLGVDKAMEQIMPEASEEERTSQARKWYQEDVVSYIKQHPEVVYRKVAELMKKLKSRFRLALVTTNTNEYIYQIIEAAGLTGIYDIVYAVPSSEKPDKAALFRNFTREHGKPKYYIAARSKEAFEECLSMGSICLYATWDEFEPEISELKVERVKTPGQLEVRLLQI